MEWETVFSILFGGGISLVASLALFYITQSSERKKTESHELKKQAADAVSGYYKLLELANLGANIEQHISNAFRENHSAGIESEDAWTHVPASVGLFIVPTRLTSNETSFLLTKESSNILQDVQLTEMSMLNNYAIWERYSDLRENLDDWMMSQPDVERQFDGVISFDKIPVRLQATYRIKSGNLNRIIGTLAENLEQDIPVADNALNCYIDAARSSFGDLFPKLKIEQVKGS